MPFEYVSRKHGHPAGYVHPDLRTEGFLRWSLLVYRSNYLVDGSNITIKIMLENAKLKSLKDKLNAEAVPVEVPKDTPKAKEKVVKEKKTK